MGHSVSLSHSQLSSWTMHSWMRLPSSHHSMRVCRMRVPLNTRQHSILECPSRPHIISPPSLPTDILSCTQTPFASLHPLFIYLSIYLSIYISISLYIYISFSSLLPPSLLLLRHRPPLSRSPPPLSNPQSLRAAHPIARLSIHHYRQCMMLMSSHTPGVLR